MFALVLAAATAVPTQDVRVVVRTDTDAAVSCSLSDASGAPSEARLTPADPLRWSWSRRPGDVLHCTGPGLEPLDSDSGPGAFPRELVLDMLPARPVTIETDWGGREVVVEWRALEAGATRLLARPRGRV